MGDAEKLLDAMPENAEPQAVPTPRESKDLQSPAPINFNDELDEKSLLNALEGFEKELQSADIENERKAQEMRDRQKMEDNLKKEAEEHKSRESGIKGRRKQKALHKEEQPAQEEEKGASMDSAALAAELEAFLNNPDNQVLKDTEVSDAKNGVKMDNSALPTQDQSKSQDNSNSR